MFQNGIRSNRQSSGKKLCNTHNCNIVIVTSLQQQVVDLCEVDYTTLNELINKQPKSTIAKTKKMTALDVSEKTFQNIWNGNGLSLKVYIDIKKCG